MATVDMFLKLDGISGDSSDRDHKGEIELLSFQWGLTDQISSDGGGAGSGKASFSPLNVVKVFDKSSPLLMFSCASGQHIKDGILTVRKAGGTTAQEFYKVRLTDIFVTAYDNGGSGDTPTDQFSLNFAKIEFETPAPTDTTSG